MAYVITLDTCDTLDGMQSFFDFLNEHRHCEDSDCDTCAALDVTYVPLIETVDTDIEKDDDYDDEPLTISELPTGHPSMSYIYNGADMHYGHRLSTEQCDPAAYEPLSNYLDDVCGCSKPKSSHEPECHDCAMETSSYKLNEVFTRHGVHRWAEPDISEFVDYTNGRHQLRSAYAEALHAFNTGR